MAPNPARWLPLNRTVTTGSAASTHAVPAGPRADLEYRLWMLRSQPVLRTFVASAALALFSVKDPVTKSPAESSSVREGLHH